MGANAHRRGGGIARTRILAAAGLGNRVIIGTAGHVDHGKSALVAALTGRAMDRLAEERRRGITIDLNFAPLTLPGGIVAGVVDVPGHEDFVRTMVAGATGMDVAILVIAADEGIMPQTREHLLILEQLRVRAGIPAVTKADAVDPAWLELVMAEAAEWLAASPVPFIAPIAVSSITGQGVDSLRSALAGLADVVTPGAPAGDLFRLPVDRAFTVAGTGTVVTGTAVSGQVSVGDAVRVLPSGREARVRSIESHGVTRDDSIARARTALALSGVERDQVARGDTVVLAGAPWEPTSRMDVELTLSDGAGAPLQNRSRIRVHHGTAEVMARVRIDRPITVGSSGLARLVLESPLVARGMDRLVIRSYSPVVAIGGGWIVDPLPESRHRVAKGLASADSAERLTALVKRRRFGLASARLPVILGLPGVQCDALVDASTELVRVGARVVMRADLERHSDGLVAMVTAHHQSHPHDPGVSDETLRQALRIPAELAGAGLARAVETRRLRVSQGIAAVPSFKPVAHASEEEKDRLVALIRAAGLVAPTAAELDRAADPQPATLNRSLATEAILRILAKEARLTIVSPGWYLAPDALEAFAVVLRQLGEAGDITPGALRDRTGLSRKYLIPLLEWADRTGITERQGDGRRLRTPPKPRTRPS
jgi:selenocysteine-specific elongation factor